MGGWLAWKEGREIGKKKGRKEKKGKKERKGGRKEGRNGGRKGGREGGRRERGREERKEGWNPSIKCKDEKSIESYHIYTIISHQHIPLLGGVFHVEVYFLLQAISKVKESALI